MGQPAIESETVCGECGAEGDLDLCAACATKLKPLIDAARDLAQTVYDDAGTEIDLDCYAAAGTPDAFEVSAYTRGRRIRTARQHAYGRTPSGAYGALIDALIEDGESLVLALQSASEKARAAKAAHS